MLPEPVVAVASWHGERCASVFCRLVGLQPVHDQVLRHVRGQLHERHTDVDDLVASLERVDPPLEAFPNGTSTAVAVYLTPRRAAWFALAELAGESAEIGEHPDLLPALPSFLPDLPFLVLSLDQHGPRLYEARRTSIHEVHAPGIARAIDDVVSTEHRAQDLNANAAGVVHGTLNVADRHKADVRRFLAVVAREVDHVLGARTDPLVLAGVDYEVAAFREASRYHGIVDGALRRPPRDGSLDQLRDGAWARVEPRAHERALAKAARARALLGTGNALAQPDEIAASIAAGAVSDLLVSRAITTPIAGSGARALSPSRSAQVAAVNAAVRAEVPVHLVPVADMPAGVELAALRHY